MTEFQIFAALVVFGLLWIAYRLAQIAEHLSQIKHLLAERWDRSID